MHIYVDLIAQDNMCNVRNRIEQNSIYLGGGGGGGGLKNLSLFGLLAFPNRDSIN